LPEKASVGRTGERSEHHRARLRARRQWGDPSSPPASRVALASSSWAAKVDSILCEELEEAMLFTEDNEHIAFLVLTRAILRADPTQPLCTDI
jgi:hypothetical protein